MLIRSLAPLKNLVLAVAGPAVAEVKSVAPNGFEVASIAISQHLPIGVSLESKSLPQ